MHYNRLDHYSEILDKLDDLLADLNKADLHFGLSDIQGQSIIQLRQVYDAMIDDLLDLENESL